MVPPETVKFLHTAPPAVLLRVLVRANYHEAISKILEVWPLGDGVEWLVDKGSFAKLAYYLLHTHLQGSQPTIEGKTVVNPATGNVFIPLFIRGKILGSIRLWCREDNYFNLGFRVRFTEMASDAEEEEERSRVREVMEQLSQTQTGVVGLTDFSSYLDVDEPITEEEKGLRVTIVSSMDEEPDWDNLPEPDSDIL